MVFTTVTIVVVAQISTDHGVHDGFHCSWLTIQSSTALIVWQHSDSFLPLSSSQHYYLYDLLAQLTAYYSRFGPQ